MSDKVTRISAAEAEAPPQGEVQAQQMDVVQCPFCGHIGIALRVSPSGGMVQCVGCGKIFRG